MFALCNTLVSCRGSFIPTQRFRRVGNVTSHQCKPKQLANSSPANWVLLRTQWRVWNICGDRNSSRRCHRLGILQCNDFCDTQMSIESPLCRRRLPRKVCSLPGTSWPVSFSNASSDSWDMNGFLISSVPETSRSSTDASTYG